MLQLFRPMAFLKHARKDGNVCSVHAQAIVDNPRPRLGEVGAEQARAPTPDAKLESFRLRWNRERRKAGKNLRVVCIDVTQRFSSRQHFEYASAGFVKIRDFHLRIPGIAGSQRGGRSRRSAENHTAQSEQSIADFTLISGRDLPAGIVDFKPAVPIPGPRLAHQNVAMARVSELLL